MNFSNFVRELVAVSVMGLTLAGCTKPEASVEAPTAPVAHSQPIVDGWTVSTTAASATRTIALQDGGELRMTLSCDFRPSKDAIANGFWLKLALELKGVGGASLGLDPAATHEQTVRFAVIRSTGEAGSMSLAISDPTHFVY